MTRIEEIEKGMDFPKNDMELEWFEEKFKDYNYKLNKYKIDPIKIINSIKK